MNKVYLALGSNLGNKFKAINNALFALGKYGNVLRTSSIYRTDPKYFENQDQFLNMTCEYETSLSPKDLLKTIKEIEKTIGRKETFRNGPRIIDVDILLYDNKIIDDFVENIGGLNVPHKLMNERDFVLSPLNEIAPDILHPKIQLPIRKLYNNLPSNTTQRVLALPNNMVLPLNKTYVMGIVNVTPDSFSDGGKYNTIDKALPLVDQMISDGVDIIDIGGESSRPGSVSVPVEDEINRVIPLIEQIKTKYPHAILSLDTTKIDVLKLGYEKGIDIFNYIFGTQLYQNEDYDNIMKYIASINIPTIFMHSKYTPVNMNQKIRYNNVIDDIRLDFLNTIRSCERNQFFNYNIILDPGIGFSKSTYHNCEIIKKLNSLMDSFSSYPMVVGPSRKRFIGDITGVTIPEDRVFGTAAAVSASIMQGCDIIRVHDVKAMKQVRDVIDTIYR